MGYLMDVFVNKKKGETFCGDRYLTIKRKSSVLYVVLDGIGHGQEASKVADIAYDTINEFANASLQKIIEQCESSLQNTRGIVISFMLVTEGKKAVEFYSVGNIETLLITAKQVVNLSSLPGIFGAKKHPISIVNVDVPKNSQLLMFTDGVGNITGPVRQQFRKMNTRHILQMLSSQWSGDDDVCILCEKLSYEQH
jgi:serine phosphatase RsbU (regulator of sigma subunit)